MTPDPPTPPHRVALVVDPEFGRQIQSLAATIHVWLVDTPTNRHATEQLRKVQGEYSLDHGVTLVRVDRSHSSDQSAAEILGTIVEHHGLYSHDPPVSAIDVRGCTPTDSLRSELASYEFVAVTAIPGGWRASVA